MDDTIKRILEIENRAQEIVGEAKSQQENFTQILSDELEQLEKSTMKRADLRIEKLRRFDEQEAANKRKADASGDRVKYTENAGISMHKTVKNGKRISFTV